MTISLRSLAFLTAYESVIAKASFRRPQHESFTKFHELMLALGNDLRVMDAQSVSDRLYDLGFSNDVPADLMFDLATGVGKTRLLGAIIVYLARSNQTKNVLILASRNAILDKFKRETDPLSPKYLFLDKSIMSEPNICFRADVSSFSPDESRLNVFILSPQTLIGTKIGMDGDFGPSIRSYLMDADDLVVLSDEAHHIANQEFGAWREAVAQLKPKLHLGFTATVPQAAKKQGTLLIRFEDMPA
ncbi:DEAD/DEAH box helicase family protein [Sphingomonas sp. H160509]|uniref:DEAD/DEAH box helicase family protein n=1 Tax=Sphingomonas sp. H160509 TaxID=2955313 RepID=UPI002096ABE6|nr:DEAD/DEAH box helicase family protein [Sphingomonas sp. H160509]MDD1449786.1 DEAD/DEAH box helicase family protein [Sphingomonas sp. H160509]